MLKIPKKYSIMISQTLCIIFFAACVIGLFILPTLCEMLINVEDNIGSRGEITDAGRTFVLVLAYLILADIMLAVSLLFTLLLRVRKGFVFTSESTSLIRGISWCCFMLCFVFAGLGIYFQLALIVSFAAVFLGIALRVVQNVIEEATEIKMENDMTI
jgi:hypothetical protein